MLDRLSDRLIALGLGVAETVKLFQFLSEEVNSLFEAYGLHTTLLEQELQKKYDALERESQQQFDALDQEWQKKYDALVADMTLVARAGIGLAGVWCANEVLDLHNDPETRTASQPLLKSVQREGSGFLKQYAMTYELGCVLV
ncbi:hypothetical protein WJX72_000492 [[Myrmecia] bisecta]|uniref:Uncharacterized protein n=1 Tax=[Myrmecia] bisecta TaxID=41462 RepID=A0AAW1QP03_9CHLO